MRTSPVTAAVASCLLLFTVITTGVIIDRSIRPADASEPGPRPASKGVAERRVPSDSPDSALIVGNETRTAPGTASAPASSPAPAKVTTPAAKPAPRPAPKPAVAPKPAAKPMSAATRIQRDQAYANTLLAKYIRQYPILRGTVVRFGPVTGNAQGEAFYKRGVIVINPNQHRGVDVILGHEIFHIIDWRDNHRIDWGERLPPRYPRPV